MGNFNCSTALCLKKEVYTWSSKEFPEEYALIYTFGLNEASSCVLRVRANHDRARFTLHDGMCSNGHVSMNVEVNAVIDKSGRYSLGPEKVDRKMDKSDDGQRKFKYRCELRSGEICIRRYSLSHFSSSCLSEDHLLVCHSLSLFNDSSPREWRFEVDLKCHWYKGLQVELKGPSFDGKLIVDRMIEDSLVDSSNDPIVKTEYKFPSKNVSATGSDSSQVQSVVEASIGLINNIGGVTHGDHNGCINVTYNSYHN